MEMLCFRMGDTAPEVTRPTTSPDSSVISAPSRAGAPSGINPTLISFTLLAPSLTCGRMMSEPGNGAAPSARRALPTVHERPAIVGVVLSSMSCLLPRTPRRVSHRTRAQALHSTLSRSA
eukprot:2742578-Rhodomonas_salina.1